MIQVPGMSIKKNLSLQFLHCSMLFSGVGACKGGCVSVYSGPPPIPYGSGPQPFRHQGPISWKTVFPQTGGKRGWFGDDPNALHLLHTLFLLSYISSTSDHQALDPEGWGPLSYGTKWNRNVFKNFKNKTRTQ